MSDPRASSTLRSLIETAKTDGPDPLVRADVWSSLSRSVATSVAPAAAKSALGGAGGGKPVSIGALFGGAVTVGLATAVLVLQPMRSLGQSQGGRLAAHSNAPRVVIAEQPGDTRPTRDEARVTVLSAISTTSRAAANAPPAAGVGSASETTSAATENTAGATQGARAAGATTSETTLPAARAGGPGAAIPSTPPSHPPMRPSSASANRAFYDPLAREASLLTQARAALGRGDPQGALNAVRAAMAVPGRQLVPEELSVESQALRALGRPQDADALTTELRARYPESALAR
ncbi:MAG TPA: hypothetical protein VEK07_01740 [Polyangiaceae bacterium]|nr:hypothetical protein [Polyangiaceae bacterium]